MAKDLDAAPLSPGTMPSCSLLRAYARQQTAAQVTRGAPQHAEAVIKWPSCNHLQRLTVTVAVLVLIPTLHKCYCRRSGCAALNIHVIKQMFEMQELGVHLAWRSW
jgi:hypothetical protein